jgi:hypothetical protein
MSFRHATIAQLAGTAFPGPCFRPTLSCQPFLFLIRCLANRFLFLIASGSSVQMQGGTGCEFWCGLPLPACWFAAGFFFVPVASAQVQSPSPGLSQQPQNIPDQKLDAAAAAIERVASLKQDYQQRIAAAAPADKERILNEAVNALAKAVTDQGLSVEEYDSILEVAQNDPDVREKIRQRIRPSAQ